MGSEISASLGERVQEHEVPIADAIEKVEELFWRIGAITSSLEEKRKLDFLQRIKSRFGREEVQEEIEGSKKETEKRLKFKRPLALRAERSKLAKDVIGESDKEKKWELIGEAKARDEIFEQYLNQREVVVNIPGLGEQNLVI